MQATLNKIPDRYLIGFSLLFGMAYFGYYIITMDWVNGGGDSYNHFLFAHYAPQHPELLLHHWAKPLFTLLLVPFAMGSIKGAEVFNVLLATGCGLMVFGMARKLGYRNGWLALLLLLFSPIVYIHVFSALTEPLGAFILTLGLYLTLDKKYIWGAVVLSFLPIVRTETFIFVPIWITYFLLVRQWKAIPFLASGFVIYSLVGGWYYGDWLWLINQNPYQGAADIYHSGSLMHFADSYQHITQLPLGLLMLIGIVALLPWKGKASWSQPKFWFEWQVIFIAFGYFSAHSVVWWLGIGGSAGLIRVMLVIAPLLVLLGIKGFDILSAPLKKDWMVKVFGLAIIALLLYYDMRQYRLPQQLHPEDELVQSLLPKAQEWKTEDNRVYYAHPVIPYFMELNPYDKSETMNLIENGGAMLGEFQPGDVFIWDSHFCPNEVRLTDNHMLVEFGLTLTETYEKTWEPDGKFEIRIYRKE
ncbi:hypothetical protein KFE98_15375 [bacterium SCSIO 12741]|nr:hypothetical protein KFE98_15375 [bacterium SCSIO 12741]